MKSRILITGLLLFAAQSERSSGSETIRDSFLTPPESAKPHTWYHWMNGNVTMYGISKDMEAFKEAGIAGFQLFDVNWQTPAGPHAYASDSWFELVEHTVKEAERNGIQFSFHNCSGWSSTGGPWVTPEKSMKWVVWSEAEIDADQTGPVVLLEPQPLKNVHSQRLDRYRNPYGANRFYADIVVLAFPVVEEKFEIENWIHKAMLNDRGSRTMHFVPDLRTAPANGVVAKDSIVDVTSYLRKDGTLDWRPESGRWTVLRFGYCSIGRMNVVPSHGGAGLEIDKLDPTAVDLHWEAFLNRVVSTVKKHGHIHEILVDSYEAKNQNWTQGFDKDFRERNGYDLVGFMPVFAGYVIDSIETTERVLWDLRTTLADLMHRNYYGRFKEHCQEHGITFVVEPYNAGPFDAAEVARMAEIPMGEYWYPDDRNPLWKRWATKIASSGAHLSGRRIVGAEAFTSWDGDYTGTPAKMKPVMDMFYTLGVNRNVFHTSAHQPGHESVKPGMSMHRFGSNFHRNNTWFIEGSAFFEYMQRCQYIFQSGIYVADVLKLYGDERGLNNLGGAEFEDVFLPGHNYDLGNTNLLKDLSVDENGDIRVSYEGKLLENRYKLIQLIHADLMTIESIQLLGSLAKDGAVIVAPRPLRSPSLVGAVEADSLYETLVDEYWDSGLIKDSTAFDAELGKLTDDCEAPSSIQFCRTRIEEGDYYFVVNAAKETRDYSLIFRISGKLPEIWNPMTGHTEPATSWRVLEDGRVRVDLTMPAEGSRFVVFSETTDEKGFAGETEDPDSIEAIEGPWTVQFDPEWGPSDPVAFENLVPWNEHSDESIRYFSGTATYSTTFNLDSKWQGRVVLDLGEIGAMARVRINWHVQSLIWHAPFVFDISDTLRVGQNVLEVTVTNSWNNRLVGDSRLAPHAKGIPDWVLASESIPASAERRTWVFHPDRKPESPLFRDGLIGPVSLKIYRNR